MNKNGIKKMIIEQGRNEIKRQIYNTIFNKKNVDLIYNVVSDKFASSIKITTTPNVFDKTYIYLLKYILHIHKLFKNVCLFDDINGVIPKFKEYKFIYKRCIMVIKNEMNLGNTANRYYYLSIDIFGKKEDRKLIIEESKQFILDCKLKESTPSNDDLYIDYKKYPTDTSYYCIPSRKLNTIYSDQIDKIIDIISGWKNEKEIYTKHSLSFKTGILLHGIPGTGKTSIAKAIASKFYMNMVTVNVASTSAKEIAKLSDTLRKDSRMKLVLLEEIDLESCGANRDEKMQELLTLLDGSEDMSGIVFIATTNYINKVDKRIKRPGRFDNIIEITDICEETAIKMCNGFEIDDKTVLSKYNKVYSDRENNLYNPAKLQKEILNEYHLSKSKMNIENTYEDISFSLNDPRNIAPALHRPSFNDIVVPNGKYKEGVGYIDDSAPSLASNVLNQFREALSIK